MNATTGWKRPRLAETQPRRDFAGLYRSAEDERDGKSFGGIPLIDAEDAATAAVRLGYKVADAQIERGRHIARRLSGAAERAGIEDASVPLDAMERLVTHAMLSGLEWIEGAAAGESSPVKRLVKAEYRLVGSMLGLLRNDGDRKAASRATKPEATPASRPAAASTEAPMQRAAAAMGIEIRTEDPRSRAVRVVLWDVESSKKPVELPLYFYGVDTPGAGVLEASVTLGPSAPPMLRITVGADPAPGRWRAAVRSADVQVGIVDIEI